MKIEQSKRLKTINTSSDSKERSKKNEDKEKLDQEYRGEKNVKKFLKWIIYNGALQLSVGILSSFCKLHSMSIVGLLIFQLLFLFVLAEIYELNFMKIFIDLMIKSRSKV